MLLNSTLKIIVVAERMALLDVNQGMEILRSAKIL